MPPMRTTYDETYEWFMFSKPIDPDEIELWNKTLEIATIADWLDTKGATLWADWIIEADDSRLSAAEWFFQQMVEYQKYKEELE